MCPNVTHMPSTSWSTTSKTLLTRLGSLSQLRPRFSNITDFHIRPDEPHRQYSPGDIVKGAVILKIIKPVRITHLTVCLHGFVRVFKNPNGANESFVDPGLTTAQNTPKSQYFGNGHISLFQDEITLCGEGRLDAGIYEFNFELMFPFKDLPTSIDFERGTISYLITSTVTRPTSINATRSCDRKISLLEIVDVGTILPPKPRTMYLTTVARRTKRKRSTRRQKESECPDEVETKSEPASRSQRSPPDDTVSTRASLDENTTSRTSETSENQSVTSSENSAVSKECGGTEASRRVILPCLSTLMLDNQSNKSLPKDQKITATIELLKSGCLPGDNLPLKISIKHTKAIRSMSGIIITLYRQGRIDSAPPLLEFSPVKGKEAAKLKHEEYYPKSKTGLRGLSLTSAGSSSIFRKDLAQTIAPIVVDPTNLTAVIRTSIRVPEYVFPTICSVPGQMITFKYSIEVIVDLGGKFAVLQRQVPLLKAVTLPLSAKYMNPLGSPLENSANIIATWGESIIRTENIRRGKNVVACSFEVVVGSKDSARSRKRGDSGSRRSWDGKIDHITTRQISILDTSFQDSPRPTESGLDARQSGLDQSFTSRFEESEFQNFEFGSIDGNNARSRQSYYSLPSCTSIAATPPEILSDERLSEKERAKLAEERLLPSCPPVDPCSPSRTVSPVVPQNEDGFYIYKINNEESLTILDPNLVNERPAPEDKQVLEHRRLLAEASAPSFPEEIDDHNQEDGSVFLEPSAPSMIDDEYGVHDTSGYYHRPPSPKVTRELLPKYER